MSENKPTGKCNENGEKRFWLTIQMRTTFSAAEKKSKWTDNDSKRNNEIIKMWGKTTQRCSCQQKDQPQVICVWMRSTDRTEPNQADPTNFWWINYCRNDESDENSMIAHRTLTKVITSGRVYAYPFNMVT